MSHQELWVSVDVVASHLGVVNDSVYRWINSKGLPAHRIGRLWRFRISEVDAWIENGLRTASNADNDGPDCQMFRPFQYLGSKLRSIDSVLTRVSNLASPSGHVVDLFSGSSVVSQAFCDKGYRVTAFDALQFCAEAAKATLGVGRSGDEQLLQLGSCAVEQARIIEIQSPFASWRDIEDSCLAKKDGDALLRTGGSVPQVWRPAGSDSAIQLLLDKVCAAATHKGFNSVPVCATHYAGTYFGIRQAIAIDSLRQAIEQIPFSPWAKSAALTSLVSAMSACAFTAGKHFAQPHRISEDKNLAFHRVRALDDRSIDIYEIFLNSLAQLENRKTISRKNEAYAAQMEHLADYPVGKVDVVYADPPYTAQQYSRFYHVPETIVSGVVPTLQLNGSGEITSGLYSTDRFKSRFSSKVQAKGAFRDLISLSKSWNAPLVISYAGSRSGNSGNARMVELDFIVHEMKEGGFSNIEVHPIDHSYRQLNDFKSAVVDRQDIEYLISGVPLC